MYIYIIYGYHRRYDGATAASTEHANDNSRRNEASRRRRSSSTTTDDARTMGMEQMGTSSKGRSVFAPAGWAFIIWAPIFLGEFLMVTIPFVVPNTSSSVETVLRQISAPYAVAQLFTTLWTASFRPKYNTGTTIYKYISALGLTGIAAALSICHQAYCTTTTKLSRLEYLVYGLPLTLHFGWTTAAALVNWNGMFALQTISTKKQEQKEQEAAAKAVAILGHVSVILATGLGVGVTMTRQAPVYGGVICWALTAVSSGMKQRLRLDGNNNNSKETKDKANNNNNKNRRLVVGQYGAERQRDLSRLGAIICASTTIGVILMRSIVE